MGIVRESWKRWTALFAVAMRLLFLTVHPGIVDAGRFDSVLKGLYALAICR
jgi:hypothetical protein